MADRPWAGRRVVELGDPPNDQQIRLAVMALKTGGEITGSPLWTLALARRVNGIGFDASGGWDAENAWRRVDEVVTRLEQPAPAAPTHGHGLVMPHPQRRGRFVPRGRVGDVVPADADEDTLREIYGADADVIIDFRRQLNEDRPEQLGLGDV